MNPFFLIFICLPAFEIYLLIKVGGQVGALTTVALIFLTAIIGLYLAKHQGILTLKSAMVNLYKEGLIGHIQIHDELDFSIESESQAKKIKDIMENAVDLKVPNKVDYESGPNWGEIK